MGKTIEEYTEDASKFFEENRSKAAPIQLKDGRPGLKIRGNPGGIYTMDGKIVSFWYE